MAGRLFLLSCAAFVVMFIPSTRAVGQDSTTATASNSVLKGVYTDDQAKKGESTYGKFCVACHEAIEHAGDVFEDAWAGRPVYEFFMKIKTTMPDDEPGKLNDQQYTDIVAYMLKLTGYPSGATILPNDPEKMRAILIERRAKPASQRMTSRLYLPHASVAREGQR